MQPLVGVVVAMICAAAAASLGAGPPESVRSLGLTGTLSATGIVSSQRVHTAGGLWCAISNDGSFGNHDSYWAHTAPPSPDTSLFTSFEFPPASGRKHLFAGGLWVGGLVDGDTLVSTAVRATSSSTYDWTSYSEIAVRYRRGRGDQEFVCRYDDADTTRLWSRLSAPLEVEVTQISHALVSPPYDRFIMIEYHIRNASYRSIHQFAVGLFADPDLFNERRMDLSASGPNDDISGFLPEIGTAYSIDNNGDPDINNVDWKPLLCPSGFAIAPVFANPTPVDTSFNWWATNWHGISWGPSRLESSIDTLSYSPASSYYSMVNGEIDYPQAYAVIDKSGDGWRKPSGAASIVARGLDTRWVLAYRFGDLAPGDSVRLVMALVVGDSIHRDPHNLIDPQKPDSFYAHLDFSDLIRNVQFARAAWSNSFNLVGAAPAGLSVTPRSDRSVRCAWSDAPFREVTGYSLYRRRAGDSTWMSVTTGDVDHVSFVDNGLTPGASYDYAVTSLYGHGLESPRSHITTVRAGFPLDVPAISAKNTPHTVGLNWSRPKAGPTYAPYTFLNIYRRTDTDTSETPYRRIPLPPSTVSNSNEADGGLAAGAPRRDRYGISPYALIDDSVTSGVTYYYRASLTNALGLEGEKSDEVKATPMLMDRRGIVLFNTTNQNDFVNFDSVWAFYSTWVSTYGFDTLDIWNPPYSIMDARLSMTLLSRYQCIVLVVENNYAGLRTYNNYDRFETYLSGGGRGVFIARNHDAPSSLGGHTDYPEPFIGRLLGITRVLYEPSYDYYGPIGLTTPHYFAARFTGARAEDPKYPAIDGDSLEAWSTNVVKWIKYTVPDSLRFAAGYVISVGAADSIDPGTDVIYTYESAYDTSVFQGKPVGLRRITDSSGAVLFNFPLSLMKHEAAWRALTLAVADLGIDTSHVESPKPITTTAAIIRWLYHSNSGQPRPEWDLNRDGVIDVRDVIEANRWLHIVRR